MPDLRPAWMLSLTAFKARIGVQTPHVGEISGVQLARMSKAARAAYDKKRRAEWAASSEAAERYAAEVMAAYDAGEFRNANDNPVSDDAWEVVRNENLRRHEVAEKQRAMTVLVSFEDGSTIKTAPKNLRRMVTT